MRQIPIRWFVVGVLAVAPPGAGSVASAVPVSLVGADFAGVLYDIDTSSGQAANSRSSGVVPLAGISLGSDGLLYALTTDAGSSPNSLFKIIPATGVSELVGDTGLTSIFEGDLDFDPTTGLLYGIQDAPNAPDPPRSLFTLDIETGQASILGTISGGDMSAMAFDQAGTLWVLNTFQEQLLRIDKTNGDTLAAVSLSLSLGSVAGMDFHPLTGELYVADGLTDGTNTLYTLDTATGVLTSIGPTALTNGLAGLEFIPEPASCFLFLAAGAVLIRRRSR